MIHSLRNRGRPEKKYAKRPPKKLQRIRIVVFFIALLVFSYIIQAYDILTMRHMQIASSTNPLIVLPEAMSKHPIAFLCVVVISIFLSKVLAEKIFDQLSSRNDGIRLSKTKSKGKNERMGAEEKSELFAYCNYYRPSGIIVAKDKDTEDVLAIPWKYENPDDALTNGNILLIGDTGSRKTSGFLIPNIFSCIEKGCTIAVTDPKGEIYAETLPAALAHGYKPYVLNLVGGHFQFSDGWDVLKPVRESESPEEIAQVIVDQIVKNIGNAEENFWNDMNINLLKLIILTVAVADGYTPRTSMDNAGRGRTFCEVINLLADEDLDKTISTLLVYGNNKRLLGSKYNTWSKHSQKDSIRSGLQSKLDILNSENLLRILSEDEVDFKKMNEEKSILYIIASDKDSTYKSILSLVSAMLFREIMEYADAQSTKSLQRPFYMFFEEFKSVGYIPDLAVKIAVTRARNINMVFCFQNIGQIKDQYGSKSDGKNEWKTLMAACALQICCGANDEETEEYFSKRSGDMTVIKESSTQKVGTLLPESLKWSSTESLRKDEDSRAPYLPSDVMAIKKSEIMISPTKHNSTIEDKYFYKHHPLYQYKAVNKKGEIIMLNPDDHIPKWKQRELRNQARRITGQDVPIQQEEILYRKFEGLHKQIKGPEDKEEKNAKLRKRLEKVKDALYEDPKNEKKEQRKQAVIHADTFFDKPQAETDLWKQAEKPDSIVESNQPEVKQPETINSTYESESDDYYDDGLF